MNLTDSELAELIYNPNYVQKIVLDELEREGGKSINVASNPFVLNLEAAIATSSAVAIQSKSIIRSTYPSLASKLEEIQLHLTESEMPSLFSTPSSTEVTLIFELTKIIDYGYTAPGSNCSELVIPIGTKITVANYDLTLLNDIFVRLYPAIDTLEVEMQPNKNPNAINNVSIISGIINNIDGLAMCMFTIPIKQVSIYEKTKTIVVSSGFKYIHKLKDKFWYAECFYKGISTGNNLVPLGLTFSEDYLDPNTPKMNVKVGSNQITFEISDIYLANGSISGEVLIKVYETKGKTFLPLDRYTSDKFKYSYGKSNMLQAKGLGNIPVVVRSTSTLAGGQDALDFETIKYNYINKTLGQINLPITPYQLTAFAKNSGLNISMLEDTIHSRIFIASRELPSELIEQTDIKCLPDTFNNTVGFIVEDYKQSFPDCVTEDELLIKSNTIFLEINGKFFVKTAEEMYQISQLGLAARLKHYNENKYYYNPFYYVVDVRTNITECRAYHLDNPKIGNLRIMDKNLNLNKINANISKHGVYKTKNGYNFKFKLAGGKSFNNIDKAYVFLQCSIELYGGNYVHFTPTFDEQTEIYSFDIDINYFIDYQDRMEILNGNSLMSFKQTLLDTHMYVYIYTTDTLVVDPYNYLVDEIYQAPNNTAVIAKTRMDLTFGMKLEYLWNKVFNTFTDRQYKRYPATVYDTYDEDVYERDIDGKIMFHVNADDQLEAIRLHKAGEQKRDENGELLIRHNKGDVILDKEGNPIIDTISGSVRYVDILMLEYLFKLAQGTVAESLNKILVSFYEDLLTVKMREVNSALLERTKIYYRSNRSVNSLIADVNDSETYVNYIVSPTVYIYIDKTLVLNPTVIETYKGKIGLIVSRHLSKQTINTMDVMNDIVKELDITLISIKIENLIPGNGQVMVIKDPNNRLTLGKNIIETEYKELQIVYAVDLKVVKL